MASTRYLSAKSSGTTLGNHEPLLAYCKDLPKLGSMGLNKNRQLIHDLKFTDKYLAGKKNPTDYAP